MEKRNKVLDYFLNDEMATDAWLNKYALDDEVTPDDMHRRLATEISRIEDVYIDKKYSFLNVFIYRKYKKLSNYGKYRYDQTKYTIYNYMKNFKHIVPQGSIMSNLGDYSKVTSLSNCFVIGQPEDSYGGIGYKDQEMFQLMKRRGGVGLDLSTIAPKGRIVKNAAKSSTGAASFMERYSNTTREVAQDGRRGALMLTLDCRHPDIFDFVNIKKDRTKVTGANISVMLRDDFMEAVKKDEDYILRFPCDFELPISSLGLAETSVNYNELHVYEIGKTKIYTKRIKAKDLYDSIVENAWENAEPGQMFIDNQWNYSPDGVYPQYRGVTTNPCGEIFMQPYDACRLIAQNLLSVVENPYTNEAYINYNLLYEVSYELQRFADDIVDLEIEHINRIINKIKSDPEPDNVKKIELDLWENIKNVAQSSRRTGSGFTGLGDMLAALNFKYDSKEGINTIDLVMRCKMEAELDCTIDLAIERGSFTGWNNSLEYDEYGNGKNEFFKFIQNEFPEQCKRMQKYGRRNVSWSTVAPTGTVSLMTQTSSGLEPLFSPYYTRRRKINPNDKDVRVDFTDQNGDTWMEYPVMHPQFKIWCEMQSFDNFDITNPKDVDIAFKKSPWYLSTANDIDWIERVEIQSIIQKYTSHSISSTINLPNSATKEEIANIYMSSFDKKLKGVTVYRDGCRTGVLITNNDKSKEIFEQKDAIKRPNVLDAESYITTVSGQKFNIIVGLLEDKPYEVFAFSGLNFKKGKGKLIKEKKGKYTYESDSVHSLDIANGMTDEQSVITRLISSNLRHGTDIQFVVEQIQKGDGDITSFTKAIARILKTYIKEDKLLARAKCDDCGSTNLRMEEGCVKCNDCGSSKCG